MARPDNVGLGSVPPHMLWGLWNRAAEHARTEALLDDPIAAELVARIESDLLEQFGKPAAEHAIRARFCDELIRDFGHRTGGAGIVVALAPGLETQFWRLGKQALEWFNVGPLDGIAIRTGLLPGDEILHEIECEPRDPAWIGSLPAGRPVFICAAGQLMHWAATEVVELFGEISTRLPGAEFFFDTVTPADAEKMSDGLKVGDILVAPPMHWGIAAEDIEDFLSALAPWQLMSLQTFEDPFPGRKTLYKALSRLGPARRSEAGALVHARAG
ncbi:MAG: class I SAM-dependent methyltransferase [Pseudomonadota bacterium]